MAVKIDEEWIRQRVHLKHDNLDDVKSLSLPGSYHEKISHLGTSLHSFTRLKHLDLSRNTVCSLEGVGHLQMLETLNLYYNNISTLKDLYQLRTLTNLKELDIRLNPVTKNEPDHRLFLIHMLPSLKKLDDRSVRDSERKAALMHFNTDQASEFTDDRLQDDYMSRSERFNVPRAELVRNLGPRSALDSDDVLLLDAITRKDDYSKPNFISGSNSKFPDVEDYRREGIQPQRRNILSVNARAHVFANDFLELANMHIMGDEKPVPKERGKNSPTYQKPPRPHFIDFNSNVKPPSHPPAQKSQRRAPQDPYYAPYVAHGNFTPTPRPAPYLHTADHDSNMPEDSLESGHVLQTGHQRDHDERPGMDEERILPSRDTDTSSSSCSQGDESYPTNTASSELRILHKLVNLVDKYWNGSKSLHNHTKFKELAIDVLKSYRPTAEYPERDMTSVKKLREEMLAKEEQLNGLSQKLKKQQEECRLIHEQLEKETAKQQQFLETSQELTTLQERFAQIQEENRSLKAKLESQRDSVYEKQKQSDEAVTNYQVLQDENHKLKQRLDQQKENLKQLNELASMLQESHRSLVATNDHLLLELADEKDRHQSEVNQLHWSYKQLKKSIDWIPSVEKT